MTINQSLSEKTISPEAQRALQEAEARRESLDQKLTELSKIKEYQGRTGPEPVRYEDWEVKGIATDF